MTPIDVRILGNKNFLLLSNIQCDVYKYHIELKAGMTTDLASIPQIAWSLIGCPSDYPFPSAIHDALTRSRLVTRKEADYIFFLLLLKDGVPKKTARIMYLALRAGGQKSYDEAIHMMSHYREYVSVTPL